MEEVQAYPEYPEVFNKMPAQPKEKKPGQLPESEIKKFFDEVCIFKLLFSFQRCSLVYFSCLITCLTNVSNKTVLMHVICIHVVICTLTVNMTITYSLSQGFGVIFINLRWITWTRFKVMIIDSHFHMYCKCKHSTFIESERNLATIVEAMSRRIVL